ncbi:trigger factor [Rhodobacteraceae bacterium LMO-12]|jgi:trigger factor|nr:trigger factor [Rhodobacteraceae bacterium LMO-JJ12]
MQVTETLNEGLKRAYKLMLTAQELDDKVNSKLAEAQPEVEMKGFRKGKVPMPILKKQFGERILGEAMQESIDAAMGKHFEDSGDRPAVQPKIEMVDGENWKEGDDVTVEMSYEALPEIPDMDLKSVKLEKLVVKAGEDEIKEALESLAESAQDFESRKKGSKAKDGDQVVFDFVGRVDGEAFEGGAAEDYPLVLGSGSFIPGFEEQLVGSKAGEEKDVTVTFPEEYQAEALAGKEAVFSCTIKDVKEPKAAEINDEMAKKFGAEDLKALKEQVSERLEAEYAGAARAVMKRALLDALDKVVSFELPPSLVEAEAQQIAHQLWHEEHPEVQDHNHDAIETTDEHKELAERRVKLGLLLAEMGQKAEVEVTDAEMTQAIMNQARQYPGQERQFFEFVQQNQQMQQQLRAPIFEDKVVDYAFELATVKDKEVSKDDLQKAVEALDDE